MPVSELVSLILEQMVSWRQNVTDSEVAFASSLRSCKVNSGSVVAVLRWERTPFVFTLHECVNVYTYIYKYISIYYTYIYILNIYVYIYMYTYVHLRKVFESRTFDEKCLCLCASVSVTKITLAILWHPFLSFSLRVEFSLKTDSGYPREAGVFFIHNGKPWEFPSL